MTPAELKVLLLEDNPGDAFLIKFYLSESTSPAFNVMHAESVKGALDLLAENKFDIIVSDMNLPDSFGVDTIKTILSKYPGNMLIVLTGLTDEEVGLETVRFGAQDFLVKGKFDGKVLVSSLMFAFERFKLNKQLDEENSRIDTIQKLLNVGYFEIDGRNNEIFWTEFMIQLLGIDPASLKGDDFFATLEAVTGNVDIKTVYQKAVTENKAGQCEIKGKEGKPYQVTYQITDGKIRGVIKPL